MQCWEFCFFFFVCLLKEFLVCVCVRVCGKENFKLLFHILTPPFLFPLPRSMYTNIQMNLQFFFFFYIFISFYSFCIYFTKYIKKKKIYNKKWREIGKLLKKKKKKATHQKAPKQNGTRKVTQMKNSCRQ